MSKDVFAAKAPHFFKLILLGTLRNGNLRIPRSFVRKYGDLASTVYLKLPSGVEWEVGLIKHDCDVWFQNGWQEFSEYCSLDFGHLLVFRYEGNSCFYVLIFDRTAVEIDYPFYSTQCKEDNIDGEFQGPHLEEINSVSSLEIIDDVHPNPNAREKSSSPCLRPLKTNPRDKTDSTPNLQTSSQPFRHEGIHSEVAKLEKSKIHECLRSNYSQASKENEEGGVMCFTKRCPKLEVIERLQQSSEEAGALTRARAFKSENPFFVVVMRPSHVHGVYGRRKLHIPYKFSKGYLNVKDGNIILLVYNGRTWSVKFTCWAKNRHRDSQLSNGWKEFVVDNNLEVGDVCVFEFINGIEISFDVKIFRAAKDAKSCLSLANEEPKSERLQQSSEEAEALRRASAFKSKNPFFMVVMRPSYINGRYGLTIPSRFVRSYIKKSVKLTLQVEEVEDKLWPILMHYYPQFCSGALNSTGWSTFARENMLQVGDVCVFELIKRDDVVLKVCIFRPCG